MNWVGGFSDPMSAGNLIASGGIPVKGVVQGGKLAFLKMEHAWVEAYVPYGPSRGASAFGVKTWIPLDASYKQYTYKKGIDVQQITGFDPQSFINQITSTATINPTTGSVTNIFTTTVQGQLDAIKTTLSSYVNTNLPNATVGDVIGAKDIVQTNEDILPPTLPYTIIAVGNEFDQVPDNLRYQISITVEDTSGVLTPLTYNTSLPAIAEKRLTLGYMPATQADAQALNTYGYYNTPVYLVNLHPVLYINGTEVAVGDSIGMGQDALLTITFTPPNGSPDDIVHNIVASTYADIGIDPQIIPEQLVNSSATRFQQAVNQLGQQINVNTDDIIGEILNLHSLTYFYQVDAANRVIAHGDVAYTMEPAEALSTLSPDINYLFGSPVSIADLGMMLDAKRYIMQPASLSGDAIQVKTFMFNTGAYASMFEAATFDELHQSGAGISTVKVLTLANEQGIPIYSIDSSNISTILPLLHVSSDVVTDVQNAVNSGEKVIIPQHNIQYNDWNGTGYIILDPTTGAGDFEISGGLAGVWQTLLNDMQTMSLKDVFDGSGMGVVDALIEALKIDSKTVSNLDKAANRFLIGLSALLVGLNTFYKTGSQFKGLEAGIVDLCFSILSSITTGLIIAGLIGGPLAIFVGTLVITVIIAIITIVLENLYLQETGLALFMPLLKLLKKYCKNQLELRCVCVS